MDIVTIRFAQLVLTGVVIVVQVLSFVILKFNDLKHLNESVNKLDKNVEKNGDRLDEFGERIANIEGRLEN